MPDLDRSIVRWLVAVAATAVCTAVNIVFQPLVADSAPFLPYFLGVSFVAFHAGRGPALLSLAAERRGGHLFLAGAERRVLRRRRRRSSSRSRPSWW